MKRIDAHQHFWQFDPVRDSWITNDMSSIQKDFLPEDLKPVLHQNGFDGCVAVQASQSEEETNFLIRLAREHYFIKGVIGWVDLQAEDIEERLQRYKSQKLVKGFRHVLQGEAERDLMLQPKFKRGIAALRQHDFAYDILVFPDQLSFSAQLSAQFPDQRFVLNHIGKPCIKRGEIKDWSADIERLALNENVFCKVSGLVTEADWGSWRREDIRPYIDVVVEAFGLERLMFGSDWPVCLLAGSYSEVTAVVKDYFSSFSKAEQDQFFGGNARHFYKL